MLENKRQFLNIIYNDLRVINILSSIFVIILKLINRINLKLFMKNMRKVNKVFKK